MSQQLYRVVFVGEVEEGRDPEVVRNQLAALGLMSAEQAGQMRPGRPVVLESGLTKDQALHYGDALRATGARCQLVPSPAEAPAPAASAAPQPVLRDTDLDWNFDEPEPLSLATTLELGRTQLDNCSGVERRMTCPKCGFEQPHAEECQACGIIVNKFRGREPAEEIPWNDDGIPEGAGQMYEGAMSGGALNDTDPARAASSSQDGFFAPEMRGIEKGVAGGIAMMVIAVVWFGLGYMAGIIFFYPPILFLFGLFAFLKGFFTGNLSGG